MKSLSVLFPQETTFTLCAKDTLSFFVTNSVCFCSAFKQVKTSFKHSLTLFVLFARARRPTLETKTGNTLINFKLN